MTLITEAQRAEFLGRIKFTVVADPRFVVNKPLSAYAEVAYTRSHTQAVHRKIVDELWQLLSNLDVPGAASRSLSRPITRRAHNKRGLAPYSLAHSTDIASHHGGSGRFGVQFINAQMSCTAKPRMSDKVKTTHQYSPGVDKHQGGSVFSWR